MAEKRPRRNRYQQPRGMVKKHVLAEAGSPSSKAAAFLTRGAYSQYVSTAQGRERRWWLFSTFPNCKNRKTKKNYDAGVSCGAVPVVLDGGGVLVSVEVTGVPGDEAWVSTFASGLGEGGAAGLGGGLGFSGLIPPSQ